MNYITQIQHHAQTRPDASAMSQKTAIGWRHLSWQQVWQQVENLAAHLHNAGIERGDRVAIFADNSIEWSLTDLACVYLGVVSVPVYATSSPDQLVHIINHAECRLMFADANLLPDVSGVFDQLPTLERIIAFTPSPLAPDLSQWLEPAVEAVEPYNSAPEDLFTIIYTSGTTGLPKGVMLTHGNIMGSMTAHQQSLEFNPGDRSLAALPLSHVFERGWTAIVMYIGGHNHYVADINQLADQLNDVKPHVFCAVPRIFEKIHTGIFQKAKAAGKVPYAILNWANARNYLNMKQLQAGQALNGYQRLMQELARRLIGRKIQNALGGNIRFIPCGGAALDENIHGFFIGLGINIKIGYGLTETLGTVSFIPDEGYRLGTLGKPMAGIDIRIDPKEGEILVRSPSMTTGYYKNPEATADLLRDGWLHTGDAGSIDEQGNLVFRERLKELMKTSGGKYIAPQHVEGVLIREQLIEQVAVIADARNYATALIVPAWEALEAWAREANLQFSNKVDLLKDAKVQAYFEQQLTKVQQHLPRYERVKRFTLLSEPFSVEGGEITPTMKLKRRVIQQRFASEIEAMY